MQFISWCYFLVLAKHLVDVDLDESFQNILDDKIDVDYTSDAIIKISCVMILNGVENSQSNYLTPYPVLLISLTLNLSNMKFASIGKFHNPRQWLTSQYLA